MALTTVRSTGIGSLPAISGSNLTSLNASNISSGTLNSARFSGGKVVQFIRAVESTTTYHTNTSNTVMFSGTITPTNSNNYILALLTITYEMYGNNSSSTGNANVRIIEGSSNVKADCEIKQSHSANDHVSRHIGGLSGYWQAGGTSELTINVATKLVSGGGRIGIFGSDSNTNASALTLMEIEA
jgi:hypothetical protein